MEKLCYSINYLNRSFIEIIDLLNQYGINCIIDARQESIDEEKICDEFNLDNIKRNLNKLRIYYINMGMEFGLNQQEINFQDMISSVNYNMGIQRVIAGIDKGFKIALIYGEDVLENSKMPVIIGYGLKKKNISMEHIIDGENQKTQQDIEETLLQVYKVKLIKKVAELSIKNIMKNVDLDMSEDDFKMEMIEEAYKMKYDEIK
ncbi:hypothetical protein [Clostridium akagii]|uniref:hypothetical protein n=1 Tax=Clostridium akagii TaxID=91623 RepID=UPI00047903F9|nr:hypothetical protein [Clostridium akagii]